VEISISRPVSSQWYRLAHFVAKPMRTLAPICTSSLSYAAPSSSKELVKMISIIDCFLSLSWGWQSSGSMRTTQRLIHRINALQHSSGSSFCWVKPMPSVGEFQVFSKKHQNLFSRHGKGSKRSTS
jgi:hypothetical protein